MPDPNRKPESFGTRIARLRTAKGWNQETLADLAGCNRVNISKIETGDREPLLGLAIAIAAALGVPVGELLDGATLPR